VTGAETSKLTAGPGPEGEDQGPSFARNALVMLVGSIVAQGLAVAVMPVLTRLYSPEAIGLQALFVSVSGAVVFIATLRLDLAVVLPQDSRTAGRLAALVLLQAVGVAAVLVALAVPGLDWLALLAPMVLFGAVFWAGQSIATRNARFAVIVLANMFMSSTFAVSAIGIGLIHPYDEGIVVSRLAGQVMGVVALVALGQVTVSMLRRPRSVRATQLWRTYWQFPTFNTPYSLIALVSRDMPLYVFAAMGGVAFAAAYALARTIMLAPISLASAALSRVFYREATVHWGTPRLMNLATTLTSVGLLASAPAFAFMLCWGDELFVLIFGDAWRMGGQFAQVLAVPVWLALQNGWPERVFEIAHKQYISFSIQLGFDLLNISVVLATYLTTKDPVLTVGLYAVSYTVYQLAYLVTVYRVAAFGMTLLMRILARGILTFGVVSGAVGAARWLLPTDPALVVSAVVSLTATFVLLASIAPVRHQLAARIARRIAAK
jgi:O-antigen/teichoic acid export membrane protein